MAKSRFQCENEARANGLIPGTPEFGDYVGNCMAGGEEGKQPPKTNPCEFGGYLGKQLKTRGGGYALLEGCKAGYKPKKGEDGRIWCCKEAVTPTNGNGTETETETEGECAGGYKLSSNPIQPTGGKIWTDDVIKPEHGFFRRGDTAGHWLYKDGKWYHRPDIVKAIQSGTLDSLVGRSGGMCAKGYQPKTINGEAWCCPVEGKSAAKADTGGEFKFSPEFQEAIRAILGRFEELLNRPLGLTDEERQAIVNYALRSVRAGERGQIQSLRDTMARTGLIGQPYEAEKISELQREKRVEAADVRSTLAIDEINRALETLLGTTQSASEILNLILATEQVPEMLSAARRKEGMDYQEMILNYLGMLMGGESGGYWDVILKRLLEDEGGSEIWDWLPWLGTFL